MPFEKSTPMAFDNGLTEAQDNEVDDCMIEIVRLKMRIQDNFPPHRSISVALTKLEEASMWLRDRKGKPA